MRGTTVNYYSQWPPCPHPSYVHVNLTAIVQLRSPQCDFFLFSSRMYVGVVLDMLRWTSGRTARGALKRFPLSCGGDSRNNPNENHFQILVSSFLVNLLHRHFTSLSNGHVLYIGQLLFYAVYQWNNHAFWAYTNQLWRYIMSIEEPNGFGEEIVLCLFPSGIEVGKDLVTFLLWRQCQVVTSDLFHCLHKLVNTAVTQHGLSQT